MKDTNYFTKELQERVSAMTDEQMEAALLELENTHYWVGILKYLQKRMMFAQNTLMTIDPIEKASEMCRTQGILIGQSDLQQMVIMLKQKSASKEEKKE